MTNLLRDDRQQFKGFGHHSPNPSPQSFQRRCAKLVETGNLSKPFQLATSTTVQTSFRRHSALHSFRINILRTIQLPSLPAKSRQLHLSLPRIQLTPFQSSAPIVSYITSAKHVKESRRVLINFGISHLTHSSTYFAVARYHRASLLYFVMVL